MMVILRFRFVCAITVNAFRIEDDRLLKREIPSVVSSGTLGAARQQTTEIGIMAEFLAPVALLHVRCSLVVFDADPKVQETNDRLQRIHNLRLF